MNKKNKKVKNIDIILNFLEKTKNGKYAKIEESSLYYLRINEQTELVGYPEEEYYYSIT